MSIANMLDKRKIFMPLLNASAAESTAERIVCDYTMSPAPTYLHVHVDEKKLLADL
jgi:hypothetical protein